MEKIIKSMKIDGMARKCMKRILKTYKKDMNMEAKDTNRYERT
jgi:hypothetical protein